MVPISLKSISFMYFQWKPIKTSMDKYASWKTLCWVMFDSNLETEICWKSELEIGFQSKNFVLNFLAIVLALNKYVHCIC